MDEDEDSRLFLSMLDAAAERIFEACSEIMAAESSAIAVSCNPETFQQNSRSLQKDEKLYSELNPVSTLPPASQACSPPRQSRKRRKRSWTSDQPVLQDPFLASDINLSGNEKTCLSVVWPANFTSPSYGVGKPFEAKKTLTFAMNFKHQRKRRSKRNVGLLPGAMLPPLAGNDGTCETETEDMENLDDFSKEIHGAIDRIESLIPSLQKLVNCVQTQTSNLKLQNNSICDDGQANRLGMTKICEVTGNDLADTGKFTEKILSGEVDQMPRASKYPISLPVNQNNNPKQTRHVKGDAILHRKELKGLDDFTDPRKTGSERILQSEKSRARGQTDHFPLDRVESLRRTVSKNESSTSHRPENFEGLRTMPSQCSENLFNQKQTSKRVSGKDKRLRFQTPGPSVGSSSFRRPNKTSSIHKSDPKASKGHAREKMMRFRDSSRRNSLRSINQISEETSWSSLASSTGRSILESEYPSSSSGSYPSADIYDSTSGETDGEDGSNSDYETSSEFYSQDQYSGTDPSSQGSSDRSQSCHYLEKGKTVGRISKFRKKLGTIFHHHHHHHHHHYSDSDESDLGHIGLLKTLRKMFNRRGKNDHQKMKADKTWKPITKSVTKKRQNEGHLRSLINGLMRHMRRSEKSKNVKDDLGRLGSVCQRGKKGKQKLPWWPKMGKGKVKVPNKGKVNLGRVLTRAATRRTQFASAKRILT